MKGTYLIFFVQENRTRHGVLVYEWLLEEARRLGVKGGTAFKAIAGFGRHGHIHADHFIELAGDLPLRGLGNALQLECALGIHTLPLGRERE